MIIIGMGALNREDSKGVLSAVNTIAKNHNIVRADWNGINILHTAASLPAALDLGLIKKNHGQPTPKLVYLLGADSENLAARIPSDAFVIYQGHHGDIGANLANVILPSPAYTEKSGTYVNVEGRVQRTAPATGLLKNAREDWAIIRGFSEVLGVPLPYDDIDAVRARMVAVAPHFAQVDKVENTSFTKQRDSKASLSDDSFQPFYNNFYLTNSVSRSSRIIAKCAATFKNSSNSYVTSESQRIAQ